MTVIRHHPAEDLLIEHAAGADSEAHALLVATHLAYCPKCRRQIAELETIGGELLASLPPSAISDECLENLLSRLDEADRAEVPALPKAEPPANNETLVPEPLRAYIGKAPERVPWQAIAPGVHLYDLNVGSAPAATYLLKMEPGAAVPLHFHTGAEYLLVLKGGFSDQYGRYGLGEVATLQPDTPHNAVGDDDGDCICLLVLDGPLIFPKEK